MERHLGAVAILLVSLFLGASDRRKKDCGTTLEVRLDNVIGTTERELRQARMHEFIWKNWRERKCATLHLKSISKEGKETDADYEIRPLPGTLIMAITINRARYDYNGQIFWHQDGKYDVYTVERVKPNKPEWLSLNPSSKVELPPESANLSGSDYCLRLTGWGNEVLSFF
jgi:hypothetical protein